MAGVGRPISWAAVVGTYGSLRKGGFDSCNGVLSGRVSPKGVSLGVFIVPSNGRRTNGGAAIFSILVSTGSMAVGANVFWSGAPTGRTESGRLLFPTPI